MISNNQNLLIDAFHNRNNMIQHAIGKTMKSSNYRYPISTVRSHNINISQKVALVPPSLPKSKENGQVLRRPNDLVEKLKLAKVDGSFTSMRVFNDTSVYEQLRIERSKLPEIQEDEDKSTPKSYIDDSKSFLLEQLKENLNMAVSNPSFTTSLMNYRRYHKK